MMVNIFFLVLKKQAQATPTELLNCQQRAPTARLLTSNVEVEYLSRQAAPLGSCVRYRLFRALCHKINM